MITKKIDRSDMFKMEKILGTLLVVLAYVFGTLLNECSADSGYFLFKPPYGGGKPQEFVAEKRSDSGSEGSGNSITPAETLWIGSHKINWSPLPLFLKFANPNLYQPPKPQQPQAQARKFETFGINPTKEPFTFQKPTPPYSNPQPYNNQQPQHQSIGNKFSFPSFNIFQPRPQPPPKPQPQLYKLIPHQNIEPRISNKPGIGYVSPVITSRSDVSTPSPIFVSTSASILVSPPGTVRALSTPGPSIRPIVDRLKKMTQWSQKKQRKMTKKEGKTALTTLDGDAPLDPLERRLRLKKRLNVKAKPQKHNIEAIILANDNDEEASTSIEQKMIEQEQQKRRRTRKGTTSMSRESVEDKAFPSNDIIIIHPSKLAYYNEPLSVQPSTVKKYEIKRKDKKMGLFKSQDSIKRAPAPVSFRFGPEDAKVSPYA